MQIRLTQSNNDLLEQYKELCRKLIPAYNEQLGTIANGMLTDKLRDEIERMKKRKP